MKKTKSSNPLLPHEKAFLKAGGAFGHKSHSRPSPRDKAIEAECKQLMAASLKEYQVAEQLGISLNTVLDRINQGSLYVIVTPSGYVCPPFQFFRNSTLPGLDVVLAVLSPDTHPIVVQRFFLTPTADLELDGEALSPREWLIEGHSPDPVVRLLTLDV